MPASDESEQSPGELTTTDTSIHDEYPKECIEGMSVICEMENDDSSLVSQHSDHNLLLAAVDREIQELRANLKGARGKV